MGDPSAPVGCPSCGQQLIITTIDLGAEVACPRCRGSVAVAALVPLTTPLPALALGPSQQPVAVPPADQGGPVAPDRSALSRGADAAHDMGARLAGRALVVDSWLEGRRGLVLVAAAALTSLSLAWPAIYAWALPAYATLLWTLLVARLWSFRDPDGRWTAAAALSRTGAVAGEIVAGVRSLADGAWTDGFRRMGLWFVGAGTVVVTVALPSEKVVRALGLDGAANVLHLSWTWSIVASASGLVLWAIGWDAQRRSRAQFQASGPVSTLSLPTVVDLRRDGVPATSPAQLKPLLEALRCWNPRPRSQDTPGQLERAYEDALVRHLRKTFRTAEIDQQAPVPVKSATAAAEDARRRVRFDILFQRSVVIELKVSLKGAAGQNALGQVRKYASVWDKGPILVVSCEASDAFAESDAAASFGLLRSAGMNVAVLAAGRRAA